MVRAGTDLRLRLPVPAGFERTEPQVWASRRDFTGRDLVNVTTDRAVTVGLSRWTVRACDVAWTEDADGQTWTVERVAQLDRGRFVELTAKRGT